jgi:hypothetical protein
MAITVGGWPGAIDVKLQNRDLQWFFKWPIAMNSRGLFRLRCNLKFRPRGRELSCSAQKPKIIILV